MARRTSTAIVRASQPIPTIRLAMPRPSNLARAPKRKAARRSSGGSAGVTPVKVAVTAAVIGLAEKSGVLDNLPEIPVVGRKGTLAIIAYYWARHGGGGLARDVSLVSAALCGYEWGKGV
jgi:hypothetical protein